MKITLEHFNQEENQVYNKDYSGHKIDIVGHYKFNAFVFFFDFLSFFRKYRGQLFKEFYTNQRILHKPLRF